MVRGGALDGRSFVLTERDGADLWIVSHFERGRQHASMVTAIVRGDAGLEEFLRAHAARIEWRRLWRSQGAA
ncbi:MAG: hypothetical protein U1F43_11060 [Myxococcota bacterium]